MYYRCSKPGCSFNVPQAFCYHSLGAFIQGYRCACDGPISSGVFFLPGMQYRGGFPSANRPGPTRPCNYTCCGKPVRFTMYCPSCAWPEDLCQVRLADLHLARHCGRNKYTQCPYCPRLGPLIMIPATQSVAEDWHTFGQSGFGVVVHLSAPAAAIWKPHIMRFLSRQELDSWGQFLARFQEFVRSLGSAEVFSAIPFSTELLKVVLLHLQATKVFAKLYDIPPELMLAAGAATHPARMLKQRYITSTTSRQMSLHELSQELEQVSLLLCGRSTCELDDVKVLLETILPMLPPPGQTIQLVPTDTGLDVLEGPQHLGQREDAVYFTAGSGVEGYRGSSSLTTSEQLFQLYAYAPHTIWTAQPGHRAAKQLRADF